MGNVGEDFRYQEVRNKVIAVAGHKARVTFHQHEKKLACKDCKAGAAVAQSV